MVTYENQSPADIRDGDLVIDNLGRQFWAYSDAIADYGDYQVMGALVSAPNDVRWFTVDLMSRVTISYTEDE